MKVRIFIVLGLLLLSLGLVTPANLIAYPSNEEFAWNKQITGDFFLNITSSEGVGYGENINVTVEVYLKSSAQNASQVSVRMELDPGLSFESGGTSETHVLGDFVPDQKKETNFTVYALVADLSNPIILVKVKLDKAGEQQWVDTPDGVQPYGAILITVFYPSLDLTGPLEITEQVVPRLRLLLGESMMITYNISNPSKIPVYNVTFFFEFGEGDIENAEFHTTVNSLDVLAPESFYLLEVEVECIVGFASISRLHFNVHAEGLAPIGRVVKIQSYDSFNTPKYDNVLVFIAWPSVLLVMAGFLIYVSYTIRNNILVKRRIAEELEAKYGKALYEADF